MPGHFGHKVLKHLGIDKGGDQQNLSPQVRLPGRPAINGDERPLSSPPNTGTYPRLCRLSDGSILSSFTRFPDGQRSLRVARSTDNGQTFEDLSEVTRASGEVDNLFLCEVAPGTVLAAFRNHDLGPNGPTWFRITVCRSTDGGRVWHYASQAFEKPPPFGIWEPYMRLGREGEVQLYFSQEFAPHNQRTMQVISRDQGSTWSQPATLDGQTSFRDGMVGIARTFDNGREALLMVFETTRHGPFNVEALLSYDDGHSWGWRHEVFRPKQGHNAGAPQVASFADGSLAAIFMTDDDSEVVQWVKNASIKIIFAGPPSEGRVQWSQPCIVSPASSSWPGILALDHHTVLAAYDRGGPLGRTITWHL